MVFGGGVVVTAVEGYFPEVVAVLKVVVGGSTEKWRNQICVINPILTGPKYLLLTFFILTN